MEAAGTQADGQRLVPLLLGRSDDARRITVYRCQLFVAVLPGKEEMIIPTNRPIS